MLGINAVVGAATERGGQTAIAALRRSASIRARVRRDFRELSLDADDLVPGDLIQLQAGDPVPADGRVFDTARLMVEESALTGKSRRLRRSASRSTRAWP